MIRKPLYLTVGLFISLANNQSALASGVPTGDAMNYGAKLMHMVQNQMDNAKEMAAEAVKRELMSQLGQNNVSAIENSTAESIARITENDAAIYNTDLERANQPPSNACDIYNSSKAAANSAIARQAAIVNGQNIQLDIETKDRLSGSNDSDQTLRLRSAKAISERLIANIKNGTPLEQVKVSNIMRPEGIDSFANEEQVKDQRDFIRLAIGHAPSTQIKRGLKLEDVASWDPESVTKFLSGTLHKNIAFSSLDYVRSVNTAPSEDAPSVSESIRAFNKSHWLDPQWIADITNTKKNNNGSTQVEEVIRSLTAITAFSAWLDSNRYELAQYQLLVDGSILATSFEKTGHSNGNY